MIFESHCTYGWSLGISLFCGFNPPSSVFFWASKTPFLCSLRLSALICTAEWWHINKCRKFLKIPEKSYVFTQLESHFLHLYQPYAQWLSKIFVLYDSIKTQHIPSIVYDIILFQQMNLLFAVASTFKMLQFATRQTFVALFVYKQHQLKWDLYKCRFANLLIFLQKFCFIGILLYLLVSTLNCGQGTALNLCEVFFGNDCKS